MGAEREILRFPDLERLSRGAAEEISRLIASADAGKRRFSLALSGGNTPKMLFALLAREYRTKIPWEDVDFFWSDERYVEATDALSNYRMAREFLLDAIGVHEDRVYAMPTHFSDAADAAADYERTLKEYFGVEKPSFDLILLGMGGEGHTASLFPDSPALGERDRLVVAVTAPTGVQPPVRLSFTLPLLDGAQNIFFLVSGVDKKQALESVLRPSRDHRPLLPAASVQAIERTVWFLDSNTLES